MTERKPLILMVEDDEDTALLTARMLRRKGFKVLPAFTVAEARALARANTPDLFILDVELPDCDGFTLCGEIRQQTDAPVLFLTGRKATVDKVMGISTGGDYYLTKPYHMDELYAVTARLLERSAQTRAKLKEAAELTRGPLTLVLPQSKALVNGCDAGLTPKEFAVLLMLVQNEGSELSAALLYESIWNSPMNDDSNAIRKHIQRLRKKLKVYDMTGFDIVSLYGGGFVFTTKL